MDIRIFVVAFLAFLLYVFCMGYLLIYLLVCCLETTKPNSTEDSKQRIKMEQLKTGAEAEDHQVYDTSKRKGQENKNSKNEQVSVKQKYLPLIEFYKTELWNADMNTHVTLHELYTGNKSEIKSLIKPISKKIPETIMSQHFSDIGGNITNVNLDDMTYISIEEDKRVSLFLMEESSYYLKYKESKIEIGMHYDDILKSDLCREYYKNIGEDYIEVPVDPGDQFIVMYFDKETISLINFRLLSLT